MTLDNEDIALFFQDGYIAGLKYKKKWENANEHWKAGYDAGFAARKVKNEKLDAYLVSLGMEPQTVITIKDIV